MNFNKITHCVALSLHRVGGLLCIGGLAVSLSSCQQLMQSSRGTQQSRSVETQRMQMMDSEGALSQSENVIQAFYQLGYQDALSSGSQYRYEHNRSLPVMILDGYRTFVKDLRIEPAADGVSRIRSISIRSVISRSGAFGRTKPSSVLFPSVMLLSDQLQLLADFKRPDFHFADDASVFKESMIADISVPGSAQNAQYMVIYVSPENRIGTFQYCRDGQGMLRFNSTTLPAFSGIPCFAVPFGMEGRVEVSIK